MIYDEGRRACRPYNLLPMNPLTAKQKAILDFINSKTRRPPTVREIAKHVALSTTTVQGHVQALRKKGCLPERMSHNPKTRG